MGRRELLPSLSRPREGNQMSYRIIGVVAVMIAGFTLFTGTALADGPGDGDDEDVGPVGEVDVPILDPNYDADIYRNGLPHPWTRETRRTVHNCGAGRYPPASAMNGTLKNEDPANWVLRGIPLYCP